jgi:hypothetical protein
MGEKSSDHEYSAAETAKRADAALRVALGMRPKPHEEMKIGKRVKSMTPKGVPAQSKKRRKSLSRTA